MLSQRVGQTFLSAIPSQTQTRMSAPHLIDACVMECYFREHMLQRDLLFHDTLAPHLANVEQTFLSASSSSNTDRNVCATFLTHLHQTLNAPSHPIRNRLLRLTADSPDLLAIIKQEGRV